MTLKLLEGIVSLEDLKERNLQAAKLLDLKENLWIYLSTDECYIVKKIDDKYQIIISHNLNSVRTLDK